MASSSALDLDEPHGRHAAGLPARYRARVLAAFPGQVERIVLFGSRARGEAHGESDWDFAPDGRFEGVVHGSYYAIFHAARAALLAVEGSASTNHGRVVEAFAQMVKRGELGLRGRSCAQALKRAQKLRAEAGYSSKDLTQAGRRLRERVAPFLAFCLSLVEQASDRRR